MRRPQRYTDTSNRYLTAVNVLLSGGRAVLYDGSPFIPTVEAFIKLIGEQKCVVLLSSSNFASADHIAE
jgi:acyl-coenzyme A synthetase/AMP-(fatty) acid ligase